MILPHIFRGSSNDDDDEEEEHQPLSLSKPIYIVTVDSRFHKTPSDLGAYQELTCHHSETWDRYIRDSPDYIKVTCPVAKDCGLDMSIYLMLESSSTASSKKTEVNGAATLLTWDPATKRFQQMVRHKAFLVWEDGQQPLSKRQVWGLVELIREFRSLQASDRLYQTTCGLYRQGLWVPQGLYEPRRVLQRAHSVHSASSTINDNKNTQTQTVVNMGRDLVERTTRGCPNHRYSKQDSVLSDAATCHHGCRHIHHDGHHDCCHNHHGEHKEHVHLFLHHLHTQDEDGSYWELTSDYPVDPHHVVVEGDDDNNADDQAVRKQHRHHHQHLSKQQALEHALAASNKNENTRHFNSCQWVTSEAGEQ